MKTTSVRVIIADDHAVIRFGLAHVLNDVPDVQLMCAVNDSTDLIPALRTHSCDVLVTDYYMPKGLFGDGMMLIAYIRKHWPNLGLIVFTILNDGEQLDAIRRVGVRGIISKKDDPQHLPAAILAVQRGEEYLSPEIESLIRTRHLNAPSTHQA